MESKQKSSRGILVVIIALISTYGIALNIGKISACSKLVMDHFSVGAAETGLLVSVFGIIGIILSIPIGFLTSKIGPRYAGVIALGCSVIGSVIGLFAPTYEILLIGRIFEGVGVGTISAIVPPLIAEWIQPKFRSIFMLLFSMYVGVGEMVLFLVANLMINPSDSSSFTNLWMLSSVVLFISLIAWIAFVRSPKQSETNQDVINYKEKLNIKKGVKNWYVWVLCIVMFCFTAAGTPMSTFTMNYCDLNNIDILVANNFGVIRSSTLIVVSVIVGLLLIPMDLKKRGIFLVFSGLLICVAYSIIWRYTDYSQAIITMIIAGAATGMLPGLVVSLSPDVSKEPRLTGITNGFIAFGRNVGSMTVGLSGMIIDIAGFETLSIVDVGIGLLAFSCTIIVYLGLRKLCKNKKQ